jgi:hypothetical protein
VVTGGVAVVVTGGVALVVGGTVAVVVGVAGDALVVGTAAAL